MKRLGIYFFFDADGIVDRYVDYALKCIVPFFERILIVCNGKLSQEGREVFEKYTSDVLVRENKGFDVWAYKTAMDSVGWADLCTYDEVILMNYTIMGPIYPLEEMFSYMDNRKELDFWGITKCFREDSPMTQEVWKCPYGYVPEHIQSSFMAFRKSFLSAPSFQKYWDELPMIHSYYESGGKHEQYFTKYFGDQGFKWDCYTDYRDMDEEIYTCCPLIVAPNEVVKRRKSPFFKRRSLFSSISDYSYVTPEINSFIAFLENETDYDTTMILPNLIRTCEQRSLVENFGLFHTL